MGDTMFQQDFEKLNKMQRLVVEEVDNNLLVLAPAGTGKTKVIAMRSANLIYKGIEPKQILCLTFTNKAAKEMRERTCIYIPNEAREITIKTFHAFCYYLIQHEKESSNFSFPCSLIDEVDSRTIVEQIIKQNGLNDEDLYYGNVLSFFEEVKRHSLSFPLEQRYMYHEVIKAYWAERETLGYLGKRKEDSFLKKYGLKLLNTYRRYLKENNSMDFMDLIVEAKYLLEQPEILNRWRHQYEVIQVDEMQDTSCREYEILEMLAAKQLSLFGDFNQTIYEWRGSNPQEMITAYKGHYKPLEIQLTTNYRSTQVLLEAAAGYISSSKLYPMVCQAEATERGEKITLLEAASKQKELQLIEQSIKESLEVTTSIAVLTRTNDYAKRISAYLTQQGIRCMVVEDTKFFRKKAIKEILAFFDYSINERNGYALLKIAQHPALNVPNWLLNELKGCKGCYMYLHDWFNNESKDPYAILQAAYEKNQIVVLDVESTGLSTTEDDVIQIAAIQYGTAGKVKELDVLLKPTKPVGDSFYVHGFSDEKLANEGIEPSEALKQFLNFIEDKVLVGHNVNYDLQILSSMLRRYALGPIGTNSVYDTLDLACKVYPKLANHKLNTLSKLVVTKTVPNHNAMQDILATSEVLKHLMEKIDEQKQTRLEKLEAYYCYISEYKETLQQMKRFINSHTLSESISYLMNECEFKQYYSGEDIKDIRKLYRIVKELDETSRGGQDAIINLLTLASLHSSEIEQSTFFKDCIPIITIHQAKGLEFDEVYIAGCNERVFPSTRSVKEHKLVEEMRLFYVAMTRAKKRLYLTYHKELKKSIFIDQISNRYKSLKND